MIRIGCAGWTLPVPVQAAFPPGPSHLQRYAQVFPACEINSSFHRPHQPATWARWAEAVPADFGFCAKLPRTITHERRLQDCGALLSTFLAQSAGLGDKLHCLLVQLPPSLAFDQAVAARFFGLLRDHHAGGIAVEPRHASWFEPSVDGWMAGLRLARVLADPVRHEAGRAPGGWPGLVYLRLHGTPRMYYSAYPSELLQALARRLLLAQAGGAQVWCIFDNTAGQAAAGNALELQRLVQTYGG
ncbi:MAG TPA: DUF72 domain-containing protein [Ramlibacter sp.]|uniref:DUF72 domain-containing protein n=1 Tax=Ramlibacter sp. TaxID=1917967 RepID=UPI002D30FF96|nr:DUF72 domain-containing protein [Ramlibacter sp.]HZY16999.1 DUF72 domain-containing protein [Ramlibacter sp.]